MADLVIPDDLLKLLREVDTPTVCNGIEVAQGQRGFDDFTRGTMVSSAPEDPAIVGFARTAKILASRPAEDPKDVVFDRRMDYYKYMASGPFPAVTVIEDMDYPNCVGSWWGEVHVAVHKGLGLAGTVTSGLVRDLGELDEGYPVIASAIGPSHAFVHIEEFGGTVEVMGLTVKDGDLVHADRHGAIVIPPEVIPDLKGAIETMYAREAKILGPARSPDFSYEKLRAAWEELRAGEDS